MVYEHFIRVRYAECDRMGFVHHSNYAMYLEEARTEILRSKGITYKEMEDDGIIMPVRSMSFQFIKAARYDDLLRINVEIVGETNVRCDFRYEIYNQDNVLLTHATTEMFFVNKQNLRPMRLPEKYLESFD
jgi:acyl-CoA thioester hydrolase